MMRNSISRTVVWVAFGSLLAARPAAGAETLNRRKAIDLAVQQNPQVAAARAQVAEAEALKGQADAARWPMINLELGVANSLQAELVPGTAVQSTKTAYSDFSFADLSAVFSAQLEVIQPLYTFGKIDHRRRASEHGIDAAQAQMRMTRADVALAVARIYEGYLLAIEARAFLEDTDHTLERTILATKDRLKSPKTQLSQEDLLRFESGRAAIQFNLHRVDALLHEARAGLRAYLGLAEDNPVAVEEEGLAPIPVQLPELDALVTEALASRPELAALAAGAAAQQELARAEWAGYLPDIVALGYLSAAYTPGRDLVETRFVVDPLYHFVPGLAVGLRWKLWGDMSGQAAEEKWAAARRLETLGDWARQGIPAEVTRALREIERARADIAEMEAAVVKAKQWVVMADANYGIGLGTSRELMDATEVYVMFRTDLMQARYRFNLHLAELAKAVGTLGEHSGLYPGSAEEKR